MASLFRVCLHFVDKDKRDEAFERVKRIYPQYNWEIHDGAPIHELYAWTDQVEAVKSILDAENEKQM